MQEYYETIKPRRVEYLRGLIRAPILKVVIGYGKAFWHDYREGSDIFCRHCKDALHQLVKFGDNAIMMESIIS
jgi:hypothetical protein